MSAGRSASRPATLADPGTHGILRPSCACSFAPRACAPLRAAPVPVMRHTPGILVVLCLVFCGAPPAAAQELAGCKAHTSRQWTMERLGTEHWKLVGQVEVTCGDETFFADEIELFTDQDRLVATGNVVFTRERAESPPNAWSSIPGRRPAPSTTRAAAPRSRNRRRSPAPRTGACSARRNPTSTSTARRCRSSASRNTRSPAAASPRACSRRLDGS